MSKEVIEAIKRSLGETGRYEIKRTRSGSLVQRAMTESPNPEGESQEGEMDISSPIPFIVSDESVDEYGTVFLTRGWKLEMFNSNPLVTWQHPWLDSSNPDDFIGTGPVKIEESRLTSLFTPEPGDTNQNTIKVMNKLKYRVVKSASVYAVAYDGRMGDPGLGEDPKVWYFTEQELIAWGIVAFPGNTGAVAQRAIPFNTDSMNTSKAIAQATVVRAKAMQLL